MDEPVETGVEGVVGLVGGGVPVVVDELEDEEREEGLIFFTGDLTVCVILQVVKGSLVALVCSWAGSGLFEFEARGWMGNKRIGYRSGLRRGLLGFTLALSGVFLCPAMVLSEPL